MLLRHRQKETNIFHPKDVKYPIYTPKKMAFWASVPVVLSGCEVDGPSETPPGSSLTQLDSIYLALEHRCGECLVGGWPGLP